MAAPISNIIPNAPRILSTISRTSLGIAMDCHFRQGVHRETRKFLNKIEGCYKVRVMHWYIKKVSGAPVYHIIGND